MTKPVMQKRIYRMISLVMAFFMSVVLLFSVPVLPASAADVSHRWSSSSRVSFKVLGVGLTDIQTVTVPSYGSLSIPEGKIYTLTMRITDAQQPAMDSYYSLSVSSTPYIRYGSYTSYGVRNGDIYTFTLKGTALSSHLETPSVSFNSSCTALKQSAVGVDYAVYYDTVVLSQSLMDDPDYTPSPPLPVPEFGWMTTAANINNILVPPGTYGDITTTISFPTTSFPYIQFSPGHRYFIRFSIYPDASRFPVGLSYWLTDVELNIGGFSFPAAYNYLNRSYVISVVNDGSFFPTSHASISATVHLASSSSAAVSVQPHFSLNVDTQVINVFPISGQVVTDPGLQDAIKDQTAAIEKGTQDQIDNANKNHDEALNGYDNSGMDGTNSQLSGTLGGMDDVEDAAMGDSKDTIKNFDFGSMMDFSAGVTSGLSFITSVVNSFISASGQFQIVILFSFLMAFLSIIVGLWRYFRGS